MDRLTPLDMYIHPLERCRECLSTQAYNRERSKYRVSRLLSRVHFSPVLRSSCLCSANPYVLAESEFPLHVFRTRRHIREKIFSACFIHFVSFYPRQQNSLNKKSSCNRRYGNAAKHITSSIEFNVFYVKYEDN